MYNLSLFWVLIKSCMFCRSYIQHHVWWQLRRDPFQSTLSGEWMIYWTPLFHCWNLLTEWVVVLYCNACQMREIRCEGLVFVLLSLLQLDASSFLQVLCLAEDMRTDPRDISSLLRLNGCDIRQSLLQLQFWTRSGGGQSATRPLRCTSKNGKEMREELSFISFFLFRCYDKSVVD